MQWVCNKYCDTKKIKVDRVSKLMIRKIIVDCEKNKSAEWMKKERKFFFFFVIDLFENKYEEILWNF